MRSRFSAFAVGDADYLLRTWHSSTRPPQLDLDAEVHWYRLDVLHTDRGTLTDTTGVVEFRAHCRAPTGPGSLNEVSRFIREGGVWLYLDGATAAAAPR